MTTIGLQWLQHQETKRANQEAEKIKRETNANTYTIAGQDRASRETIAAEDRISRQMIASLDRTSRESIATQDRKSKESIAMKDRASKESIASADRASKEQIAKEDRASRETVADKQRQTSYDVAQLNGRIQTALQTAEHQFKAQENTLDRETKILIQDSINKLREWENYYNSIDTANRMATAMDKLNGQVSILTGLETALQTLGSVFKVGVSIK